jgi:hypothetical protein
VTKTYPGVRALHGVDLEGHPGELMHQGPLIIDDFTVGEDVWPYELRGGSDVRPWSRRRTTADEQTHAALALGGWRAAQVPYMLVCLLSRLDAVATSVTSRSTKPAQAPALIALTFSSPMAVWETKRSFPGCPEIGSRCRRQRHPGGARTPGDEPCQELRVKGGTDCHNDAPSLLSHRHYPLD